ncbi:MAG TPA: 3-hydroxyacyl-CoA dehydrogenase NAD-binding domain-containing protein [Thermoanaerobaculia bacterium]|jgi:3-hydroxyacyl-CoA dehydrogenase|nr:3-hydroxyacyl-CoA dehydrogenase NAD-binding domain-containing protein [Thermoanaerobaculia bacterium]
MTWNISRAVVIGSGTMGGGIAAHFANAGIPVYLLDISQQVARASLDRLKKNTPAAFVTPATAELVTIGSLDDNESWISEGDWIIEAIVENLDAKRELVKRIDRLRKQGSIVSSNTSGIPIAQIAAEASSDFKAHFLGTHFFNPPRYMKLLEVIPTPDTLPDVTSFVREFAETRLGKSVVFCKDTPNFIANRLASIGGVGLVEFALEHGYTVEETDLIAGPLLGRPKTAAFRLQDLVGFDIASAVAENLYGAIPNDESRETLHAPRYQTLRQAQMDKGRLGDKTKQGFYRKDGKQILSLDLATGEYRDRVEPQIASLAEASKIRSLPERVKFVLAQDDKAGAMARHIIYDALGYAARRVPEISDDLPSIDNAVRWGFSHDLGPFELWDALGVKETADAMEANRVAVAPWVREMLDAGHATFYRERTAYDPATKTYAPVPQDPKHITLSDCAVVIENKGASLRDLGDGVLCLEFHTKMNTLDDNIRAMLNAAVDEVERGDWKGLVIANDGLDFCVGANLTGVGTSPSAVEGAVKGTQDALMNVRFCTKPVVTAPFGRTLGGGAEVAMAGARIVAASELYLGLVEVGVGLIPGAGGCKELVRRIVSPPQKQTPGIDAVPFLSNVLTTIGTAKVSSSAEEARSLGFLTIADRVVMNRDHLTYEAKQEVLVLASENYTPPVRDKNCYAAGRDVRAALKAAIYNMQQAGYATEYDAYVSGKLAHILCGGDLSSGQWVDEQYLLDLEREVFIELCAQPKTLERIQHMLTTGKPLRN